MTRAILIAALALAACGACEIHKPKGVQATSMATTVTTTGTGAVTMVVPATASTMSTITPIRCGIMTADIEIEWSGRGGVCYMSDAKGKFVQVPK